MVFIPYVHLYCLLLNVQQCCHLLLEKVTNKIKKVSVLKSIIRKMEYNGKNERQRQNQEQYYSGTQIVLETTAENLEQMAT